MITLDLIVKFINVTKCSKYNTFVFEAIQSNIYITNGNRTIPYIEKHTKKIKQNKTEQKERLQITTSHKANLVIHLIGEKHNQ